MTPSPSRLLCGGVLLWLGGCSALTSAPDHPAEQALRERLPPLATASAPSSPTPSANMPQLPWPGSEVAQTNAPPPPAAPLTQDAAVRLSLQHSPALRALLAQSQAQEARLRASARPGLFGISLERLRRGDEVDVGRTLSLGLLDLLTWPWRDAAVDRRVEAEQWQLTRQVLSQAQAARVQWVQAVPRLCDDYHGICLTTEEKARKNLS